MADPIRTFAQGFPAATAVRLEEMIDAGDDAVVSRTLAKGEAGTLTLFAFDQGQELSEHTAPFDAFVQVLEGEVLLRIGGQDVIATAGQGVLMPAGVPHSVHATRRLKMLLTMLRR